MDSLRRAENYLTPLFKISTDIYLVCITATKSMEQEESLQVKDIPVLAIEGISCYFIQSECSLSL